MIDEIEEIKSTERVELKVFEWNLNAVELYKKMGFTIQPESTYEFKYNDEILWTSLSMTKQLKKPLTATRKKHSYQKVKE